MKRFLACLASSFLVGCSTISQKEEIPCRKEFFELCKEENIVGVNDCSNKSGELYRKLKERGKYANLIIIYKRGRQYSHAIVQTEYKGRLFYMDPAQNKAGWILADLHPEFDYLQEVSEEEINRDFEFRKIIDINKNGEIKFRESLNSF